MAKMKQNDEWHEDEATWKLLGKSTPAKAGDRFADDAVRAVKVLPEGDAWLPNLLRFSPWLGLAACAVFASWLSINQPEEAKSDPVVNVSDTEEKWSQIEDVAEVEMLSAAVEHIDQFSDQELITMIGL